MKPVRVLAAASAAIAAESWVNRKVRGAFPEPGAQVTQLGTNAVLTKALEAVGCTVEVVGSDSGVLKRTNLRKVLSSVEHMFLLWDGRTLTELLFEARLRGLPTKLHTIETTEVVNRDRDEPFDAYVGRGTPWGNPFRVGKQEGQFERAEAIDMYKNHFETKILRDKSLRSGLLSLRGLRIACHCKPQACHGDVIARYLNLLDPDDVGKQVEATYRLTRDSRSSAGFTSPNAPSTDALTVLKRWQLELAGRSYEVLFNETSEGDVLEARLTYDKFDERAATALGELSIELGIQISRINEIDVMKV
jgi:hypothetical protein